ncbi:hypothetical protein SETIT_3G360800v2 [Setaria italica]|uniref:Pectinesterase inhibitor domain-containing protein n=1 Tax=Setaria italica TaxID=4555 RepID=A0A368QMD9_SETIT|nr:hypothetical protein SETIT_3G360800v2 [Setaria italica]
MAPCRFCKHQGVAAGGLALLAALVVIGLALPGGAAAQQRGQDIDKNIEEACRRFTDGSSKKFFCVQREREIQLSNMDPCERFFQRFAFHDTTLITSEDARGCLQAIKTCTVSCQKQ